MGCQHSHDVRRPGDELAVYSTVLDSAVAAGNATLVDKIFTKYPDLVKVETRDVGYVVQSCTDAKLSVLRVLLRHGADPDEGLEDGVSALHLAAMTNQAKAVKLLLDFGANANARLRVPGQPMDGMTAMHLAARSGFAAVAEVLIENKKVDLTVVDASGCTAAEIAASRLCGLPVFEILRSNGLLQDKRSGFFDLVLTSKDQSDDTRGPETAEAACIRIAASST